MLDVPKTDAGKASTGDKSAISPPSISLPKGGGAIRGIGEKFAANPVTGTGSMTVPIATSPGRSGFGPALTLSYDSGTGNGPFGLGWHLSLPAITRKTDKGLPKYQDADESDVFILSGAEDLVPVLTQNAGGQWVREAIPLRNVNSAIYRVQRYRPRIEGLFARIERWTNQADPADTFWRSISKDNITTWYGKTSESRVADPADSSRIFSWLICESYDDKGNVIGYAYKEENSDGVDLSQAHERNRTPDQRKAHRYLKHIRYGNHVPYFPQLTENSPWPTLPPDAEWYFEVVFDYGEHDADAPTPMGEIAPWPRRNDPFSSYRAGFEIRTYRLCRRVLMFHHFSGEADVGEDCLVRSTDFTYSYEEHPTGARNPIFSTLLSVSQSGYKRQSNGYLKQSFPPVEFHYTEPNIDGAIHDVDADSLENLPAGLDGRQYQWIDLDGEGLSGILTEQAKDWFYKRNLSPINLATQNGDVRALAKFAPVELVATKPNSAIAEGQAQFMDLAGDGQPDLVMFESPTPGFYEHDEGTSWKTFRSFSSRLNRRIADPNLKFVDLDGDGHADVLITEDDAFTWYPSLAEEGFAPAQRVSKVRDEEQGPRIVFADGTQSIYLADLSGDGLTDLVRIRNGEICYWPNLGYGRFGAKVTTDNAPWFDRQDQFDQKRIRLADIDGSGTTDIIYLHRDGARLYFNQSGNSWSRPTTVTAFPRVDNLTAVTVVDLLGNGTACLVWSSPLPGNVRKPMRYIDLMGGHKPHLLVKTINNLGAETDIAYAPSTKFYLQDKLADNPWITRLPFPVHVIERVETFDHVSHNRFVTRYAYHHGYFDGVEREFRGFGMVEQWDTEQFAALARNTLPATNITAASHVPPVHTKTWFHTGVFLGRERISRHYENEYFREPGLSDDQTRDRLLPDTVLPEGLTIDEQREACRALKGSMLRQEVYADDAGAAGATAEQIQRAQTPYTVTEQNFSILPLQPFGGNRHAVFFTHVREALSYHYERNPADPHVQHALTLEVDDFGNVLKQAAVGYGRRVSPLATQWDQDRQTTALLTYTENRVTNAIEAPDAHRTPLSCEAVTSELTGYRPSGPAGRFQASDFVEPDPSNPGRLRLKVTDEVPYEGVATGNPCRRPIEWLRTLYRSDDLSGLLPLGVLQPLNLPGESYKLAFTPGLLTQVFQLPHQGQPAETLLPDPAAVLAGHAPNQGGYLQSQGLKADGRFPAGDPDGHWWIPSGQAFFSANQADNSATELAYARQHFFLPHRYRDPFGQDAFVDFDAYDLLMTETRDALGNRVTVDANDYRVLQPRLVSDPNRNQTEVAFDTLGMVVGTAVMGKPLPAPVKGDSLVGFVPDLTQAEIDGFFEAADPHAAVAALLKDAGTRIVYDLDRFRRTRQADPNDPSKWQPVCAATLARETHASSPLPPQGLKIQLSFSYSDGFGREIQKKVQAEPGPVPQRDADGKIIVGSDGQPVMTATGVSPRWVGSGWTVFNNKGKPVRQYEPFFTDTHHFEFDPRIGVSPVLFYDPVERVVATLHPNHTWEKVVFDPWRQETWDVNDTVLVADPKTDPDVGDFFRRLPDEEYLPTWYGRRAGGSLGSLEQEAATKAAAHAGTPSVAHADSLVRTFLMVADNAAAGKYFTRVELDIEGNQRAVRDAVQQAGDPLGRVVMRYAYNMLGHRIHQASMEAGERWMLNDVAGKPLYAWDSLNHRFRTSYDPLRRPRESFLQDGNEPEILIGHSLYGEGQPNPEAQNQRGKVVQSFDQAGIVTTDAYDFKGNLLHGRRQLAKNYKTVLDWVTNPDLESENFTGSTTFDALNRPVTATSPDGSVYRSSFNEANLLEKVEVNLRGAPTATPFVTNIDYNAKRQRTLIEYGNHVKTEYAYDSVTFRLTSLKTMRATDQARLQDLSYTYDPIGNITQIQDSAQQTIYFNNQVVTPNNDYTYDAIYRLITAAGREHIGQAAQPETTWNDQSRVHLPQPGDGQAMRRYSEQYEYDPVGNFQKLTHQATNGNWTRRYTYNEASQTEPAKNSNRLSSTIVGRASGDLPPELYPYDPHGNMLAMAHLPHMEWDFKDELRHIDLAGGGESFYVYDAGGQRVRKVIEKNGGTLIEERIYLGGFEIFRRHNGAGTVTLEHETLHVMDDKQRIALVETKTIDTQHPALSTQHLFRYQFSNHLGSASLELDDAGQIISYEEYYPYGSTSYQAVRSGLEASPKRYRYTGMERDEESGFNYHGARYYAPWLGRWVSVDPKHMQFPDWSPYSYALDNPSYLYDPSGQAPESPEKKVLQMHIRDALQDVKRLSQQLKDIDTRFRQLNSDVASARAKGQNEARIKERFEKQYAELYGDRELAEAETIEEQRVVKKLLTDVAEQDAKVLPGQELPEPVPLSEVLLTEDLKKEADMLGQRLAMIKARNISMPHLPEPTKLPKNRPKSSDDDFPRARLIQGGVKEGEEGIFIRLLKGIFKRKISVSGTATIGLFIWDFISGYIRVASQHTFAGQAEEAAAWGGRLTGATLGAEYGLSVGGPWGALLGGALGGIIGDQGVRAVTAVGKGIEEEISKRITSDEYTWKPWKAAWWPF